IESNGFQPLAAVGVAYRQLNVPTADDLALRHLELAIEQRLREALSPGSGLAQDLGDAEVMLVGGELAVGEQLARQHLVAEFFGNGSRESRLEAGEILDRQAQPGRHGVTAEARDQAGMAIGDALQQIANMQTLYRAG